MKKILVIGSTNIDFVVNVVDFPVAGETVMSQSFQKMPGGKGANQAYACGKLGGDTAFVSVIGDDGLGDLAMKNLKDAGVNIDSVKTAPGTPTGMAQISIDHSGNNCIIVVPGANSACNQEFIEEIYDRIDACDILLIQMETPLAGVLKAIQRAKQAERP